MQMRNQLRVMAVLIGLFLAVILALPGCQSTPSAEATPGRAQQPEAVAGSGNGTEVAQAEVALDRYPPLGVYFALLNAAERARFVGLAEAEICPCGGTVTSLDACLQTESACMLAFGSADILMRMIKESATDLEIADALRQAVENARRVHEFDLENTPYKGADEPVLTIVEFADFQCPHCRMVAGVMSTLNEEFGDRVRFYYKNFPLDSHPAAALAAVGARAAHRQGAFWGFHDTVFANQQQLGAGDPTDLLVGWAVDLGMNGDSFRADLNDPVLAAEVAAERQEGIGAGLQGTPTIYVNGVLYSEPSDLETMRAFLTRRLAQEAE
jgi:protein-disulfide isomerase